MRKVRIVGVGQLPVRKEYSVSLRKMASTVIKLAMEDAGLVSVDALFAANMLADELQGQKHIAALIADESGLEGIEALQVRAATASGAAALRMAYLAVASGSANSAVAVGVEKMSEGCVAPVLAKALDAEFEQHPDISMVSRNASLTERYIDHYKLRDDALADFPVNAHHNAVNNPNALFPDRHVNRQTVIESQPIYGPLRLFDCSPICDGAAAVILTADDCIDRNVCCGVSILASSVATDRFRIDDRKDPLWLSAAHRSVQDAFQQAGLGAGDINLFELHDAFSIMACLSLEAAGFARRGEGWRLAADGAIHLDGVIPIASMGGLKARGHPIGATALYQTAEIVAQLNGRAGKNQIASAKVGMMQSVGGVASTVITHILGT